VRRAGLGGRPGQCQIILDSSPEMPAKRYRVNIPALLNVADAHAHAHISVSRAPGIVKDTNVDVSDVEAAHNETSKRYKLRSQFDTVSAAEVGAALVREHAVISEHVSAEYHGGAPAWFAEEMAKVKAEIKAEITNVVKTRSNHSFFHVKYLFQC
jgi:hypothetical protein